MTASIDVATADRVKVQQLVDAAVAWEAAQTDWWVGATSPNMDGREVQALNERRRGAADRLRDRVRDLR